MGCKQIESQRKQILLLNANYEETKKNNTELNSNNEALMKTNQAYKNSIEKLLEEQPYFTEHFKKFNLDINYSQLNNENNIQNLIKEPKGEIDPKKFYDVIVPIQSIKDIIKGWKIKFAENFKYKEFIKDKFLKIGVIGNSNKGKSFILSKLSKMLFPSGTSIKTEGLSIKYPDLKEYKNRKIVLLDSAGLETPVLQEINEIFEDKKKKEKIIEKNKKTENPSNANKKDEINNIVKKDNKDNFGVEVFKEKSREKILTELFLQNYIIFNSDILIVVVGLLTYSEQKILNRIKTELIRAKLNKTLYVIHNLMTYTTIKQVQNYIEDVLLKSATFELEKQLKINTRIDNESERGVCFYEKESTFKIFHLIYANEGSDAGKYYNEYTLNFIENIYENNTDLKCFDIVKSIKERFKEVSKEFFEKLENEISFEESEEIIKLKEPKDITLKRCFIDELGFSIIRPNGFDPKYNYYLKDNKIIVNVEIPGQFEINSSFENIGEYIIIKLRGTKNKDNEPIKIEDNIFNGRELGIFALDIPFKHELYNIKNENPEIKAENGIVTLAYQLEERKGDASFILEQKK